MYTSVISIIRESFNFRQLYEDKETKMDEPVLPTPALPVYTRDVSKATIGSLDDKLVQQCSD